MSETRFILSLTSLIVAALGVACWLYWMWRNRPLAWFGMAPTFWLLHVVVFYTFVLVRRLPPTEFTTTWSAAVRLHALITLLAIGLMSFNDRRKRRG